MSAALKAIPGGQPSITQPMAAPCDSPKLVTANKLPKVLPLILLQRFEAHAFGLGAFFAQASPLVGFVFMVIAVKESPLAVALAGQNVGGNAVKEPAVMADHHDRAGKLQQAF